MSIRNSQFLIRNCTALVAANRELITRFEQKIQATLARVWGEAPAAAPGESLSETAELKVAEDPASYSGKTTAKT
jgi:hypothetical protein